MIQVLFVRSSTDGQIQPLSDEMTPPKTCYVTRLKKIPVKQKNKKNNKSKEREELGETCNCVMTNCPLPIFSRDETTL